MKTLFRYVAVGQKFECQGHSGGMDKMVRRAPNKNFPTTCDGCEGIQYANAILQGITIGEADEEQLVHLCPNDYVFVKG